MTGTSKAGWLPVYERMYRSLYRIRRVEEEVARIYPTDKIKSPIHLSTGQEAVSVGVCEALDPNDVVFGTYRSHALYLAKGGNLKTMLAELYGKVTGCCKGKGGSMHLIDIQAGVMGTSAVVATTIPQAVGYAYALKHRKDPRIVVSFFGDGAVEEGAFHESMNFAALKKLPVIFICENNFYAVFTPLHKRQALDNIYEKASAYGIPSRRIEDNDILEIYQAVRSAARKIRESGEGPVFFECRTYRWKEHVGPNEDYDQGYRSREELLPWKEKDQVERIGRMLDPETRRKIEKEVEEEIREAIEFAEKSPFPPAEELYTDLFKD